MTTHTPGPNLNANARLMAAAPELLEALKANGLNNTMGEWHIIGCHVSGECAAHCQQARAAVARAEGRG